MIEIKLSFETLTEAQAALAMLVPVRDVPSGAVKPKAVEVEPALGSAELTHAEQVAAEKKRVAAAMLVKAEHKLTYAEVKAAVGKLALIGVGTEGEPGRAAVKNVLGKLGLESFKDSPEDYWPKAMEMLKAETLRLQAA